MIIGCSKEVKDQEFRVGITPVDVLEYLNCGHEVLIEDGAGEGIDISNEDYIKAGAKIVSKEELFDKAKMIVKVKEPIEEEYKFFKEGQILYTYLHLAADEKLTRMLLDKQISAFAYETIQEGKKLPCLSPMSAIAGRLAVIQGCKYLEKTYGGNGMLLSGLTGVKKGKITILGSGMVGLNAAQLAFGMGAEVVILGRDPARLEYIDHVFNGKITTLYSNIANILESVKDADVVIGAALVPGSKTPKLLQRKHLKYMKKGSVIVDVAIDQGGCFETSRATTHTNPIYEVDGVIHYAVGNMPGAVAKTATMALVNATTPYGIKIANLDVLGAITCFESLRYGLNTYKGACTHEGVARAFNLKYTDPKSFIER